MRVQHLQHNPHDAKYNESVRGTRRDIRHTHTLVSTQDVHSLALAILLRFTYLMIINTNCGLAALTVVATRLIALCKCVRREDHNREQKREKSTTDDKTHFNCRRPQVWT